MNARLLWTYRLLYMTYVLLPIVAGADKFFYNIGLWPLYINPAIPLFLNMSMDAFMKWMGVVEILVGLVVLWKPALGGRIVTLGVLAIAINVFSTGLHWDVAVRDIIIALGSYTFVVLSEELKYIHNNNAMTRS
ncbi:hypothetical protein H0W26_01240 [Candidatus Dependentiae bacterium]|nr:hypothetical protein [Candidatus Dependentiae bacterium]